jgi:hypothetical protein
MNWRQGLVPPTVREHSSRSPGGAGERVAARGDDTGTSPRPEPVSGAWSLEAANPFAEVPPEQELMIAQVRRQLANDLPQVMTVEPTVLDQVAERVVRELWESRIKTFVPLLALRQAREILRDEDFS